jgi:DNA mismatch repair protein MutS2
MRIVTDSSSLTVLLHSETAPLSRRPADVAPRGSADVAASLEIDLRGMTGDEAEMATVAAVDAAVLAEQPFLRIIHGMGTGVVRDRVQRVVSKDRRVSRFAFAPRNQGGTGVTIVEFSA